MTKEQSEIEKYYHTKLIQDLAESLVQDDPSIGININTRKPQTIVDAVTQAIDFVYANKDMINDTGQIRIGITRKRKWRKSKHKIVMWIAACPPLPKSHGKTIQWRRLNEFSECDSHDGSGAVAQLVWGKEDVVGEV